MLVACTLVLARPIFMNSRNSLLAVGGVDTGGGISSVPRFSSGEIPVLTPDLFPGCDVGDTVAEGVVYFASVGTYPGLYWDSEYLRTDDGNLFFDNNIFRGLHRKRVRIRREPNGFAVSEISVTRPKRMAKTDQVRAKLIQNIAYLLPLGFDVRKFVDVPVERLQKIFEGLAKEACL